MLARRFTVFCLLVTLFGMAFAILVADHGGTRLHRQTAGAASCLFGPAVLCQPANSD